jgi:hypothetical protein
MVMGVDYMSKKGDIWFDNLDHWTLPDTREAMNVYSITDSDDFFGLSYKVHSTYHMPKRSTNLCPSKTQVSWLTHWKRENKTNQTKTQRKKKNVVCLS